MEDSSSVFIRVASGALKQSTPCASTPALQQDRDRHAFILRLAHASSQADEKACVLTVDSDIALLAFAFVEALDWFWQLPKHQCIPVHNIRYYSVHQRR